jgi:hypothetical protein
MSTLPSVRRTAGANALADWRLPAELQLADTPPAAEATGTMEDAGPRRTSVALARMADTARRPILSRRIFPPIKVGQVVRVACGGPI